MTCSGVGLRCRRRIRVYGVASMGLVIQGAGDFRGCGMWLLERGVGGLGVCGMIDELMYWGSGDQGEML